VVPAALLVAPAVAPARGRHIQKDGRPTMASRLNPYLTFRDNARQAMEFYQSVFGGKLDLSTFAEMNASPDPAEGNKIMHSVLETDDGMVIMGADTPNSMDYRPGSAISVSLSGDDDARLSELYRKLSESGSVTVPLEKAPWGDRFGMCVDGFGTAWLVNISGQR
jgi:PhnB protein